MAFFSQETGLAEGIRRTVQTGILLASATPGPLLAALMDGEEKALVIHYFGPEDGSTYDPNRMDGEVALINPGDPGYRCPPSIDLNDRDCEIRAGVPLWLLRPGSDGPLVLGIGRLHTRWSAANIDFYDPSTRRHVIRFLFTDPRQPLDRLPEGWPNADEQLEQIKAAGGALEPAPFFAPNYPDYHYSGTRLQF